MLIIVNPYATTVSDRLKNLVVYALQGRYEVEAVSTEAQHHATEIGREAREGGYDVVVAFGGDGTLNEVANGLAGTDVPVSVLPGRLDQRRLPHARDPQRRRRRDRAPARRSPTTSGRARSTSGSPTAATSSSPAAPGSTPPRRSASTPIPRMKARGGRWYYTWAAISGFYRALPAQPGPDAARGRRGTRPRG